MAKRAYRRISPLCTYYTLGEESLVQDIHQRKGKGRGKKKGFTSMSSQILFACLFACLLVPFSCMFIIKASRLVRIQQQSNSSSTTFFFFFFFFSETLQLSAAQLFFFFYHCFFLSAFHCAILALRSADDSRCGEASLRSRRSRRGGDLATRRHPQTRKIGG